MNVRRIGIYFGAFIVASFCARADAVAAAPCPDNDPIWVSRGIIYDRSETSRHSPGHPDCFRHAFERGARRRPLLKIAPPPEQAVMALPPVEADLAISDSVYDVIDRGEHAERSNYGRYTYVLLTNANDRDRNLALIRGIVLSTPSASSVSIDTRELNIFEIPETAPFFQLGANRSDPEATLAAYDFGFAHDLLHKACATANSPHFCGGDLAGPFLLTYGRALGPATIVNPPFLVVDLHRFNAHGFDEMIALMKQQVKRADYPDGRLVEGFSVRLLSFALDVSDWLPGLTSDTKTVVNLVPAH